MGDSEFYTTEALPRFTVEAEVGRRIGPGEQFVWPKGSDEKWCCTAAKENTLYAHRLPKR